jgi:hypothetical protein
MSPVPCRRRYLPGLGFVGLGLGFGSDPLRRTSPSLALDASRSKTIRAGLGQDGPGIGV